MVEVPNFVGAVYDEIDPAAYPDFKITLKESVFDDEIEEGKVINQSPESGDQVKEGTEIALTVSLGPKTDEMPKLKGQLKSNAEKLLKLLDLNLTILFDEEYSDDIEEGRVTRTDPDEGATLEDGQSVTVYISKGPEEKPVKVPNLIGMTEKAAIAALNDAKLDYSIERKNDDAEAGKVIGQSVDAGEEVDEGTKITLTISLGPAETPEPDPEPTPTPDPKPSTVSKPVTLTFEDHTTTLNVSVVNSTTGETVVTGLQVQPGTNTASVYLQGSGTVVYYVYVDNTMYTDITVNFDG